MKRPNVRRRIGNEGMRGNRRRMGYPGRGNRIYRGRNVTFRGDGRRRGNMNRRRNTPDNGRRIPIRRRLGKRRRMNAEQLDNDLDNYHKKQGEGNNYKDYLDNDLDSYRREGESKMSGNNNKEEDKKE